MSVPHGFEQRPADTAADWGKQYSGSAIKWARETYRSTERSMTEIFDVACQADGDVFVMSIAAWSAYQAAEVRGLPGVIVSFAPFGPTREFPTWWASVRRPSYGAVANRLTHVVEANLTALLLARPANRWRAKYGLPPVSPLATARVIGHETAPVLFAYSEALVPRPVDWPPHCHVTGFWFLPPSNPLPPVAGPDPVVFVGLGSMTALAPPGTVDALVEGARRAGAGTVIAEEDVPHDALFPHVDVVVHHGGAGTTAAALRAGRPSVCVPVVGDQHYWATLLHRCGAAPARLPAKKVTVERARAAIVEASTPTVARASAAVGARIAADDGTARAVELIERYGAAGRAARISPRFRA